MTFMEHVRKRYTKYRFTTHYNIPYGPTSVSVSPGQEIFSDGRSAFLADGTYIDVKELEYAAELGFAVKIGK